MKTWHILELEPNSSYKASIFREEVNSEFGMPPSSVRINVELYTDGQGNVSDIKDNPMIFGGIQEVLDDFEVTELTNLADGNSFDFRFFAAAMCNSAELASDAKSGGCNPNLRAKQSTSALHIATMKGYLDIIEILLDAGAELDASDSLGWPPIFIAVKMEKYEAADFLHAKGAKTTATVNGKEISLNKH